MSSVEAHRDFELTDVSVEGKEESAPLHSVVFDRDLLLDRALEQIGIGRYQKVCLSFNNVYLFVSINMALHTDSKHKKLTG